MEEVVAMEFERVCLLIDCVTSPEAVFFFTRLGRGRFAVERVGVKEGFPGDTVGAENSTRLGRLFARS
jgi:hypothetical protein